MIGDGKPGTMFRRLMAAWNDLVGIDIVAQAEARRLPLLSRDQTILDHYDEAIWIE